MLYYKNFILILKLLFLEKTSQIKTLWNKQENDEFLRSLHLWFDMPKSFNLYFYQWILITFADINISYSRIVKYMKLIVQCT